MSCLNYVMTTCVPEAWVIHTLVSAEKKRCFAVGILVDGDLGRPWSVHVL